MSGQEHPTDARGLTIEWAGEALTLLPERALWWPRTRTLFIADPHFGKAAAFRFAGIPVPETMHADDLTRLADIVARTAAERLVILGDFLHSRTGRSDATLDALAEWRPPDAALEVVLIMGNHDLQAGPPPREWNVQCVAEPWALPPFQCCHQPQENAAGFVLAGHVHPAYRLSERFGATISAPCFLFSEKTAILPAFGSFTGTHAVHPAASDRVYLVGDDEVVAL